MPLFLPDSIGAPMQIDAMLGLMRVAETGDRLIPDLAKTVMTLMAHLKEMEMRAGLAEAQLADERAQVSQLQATLRRLCNAQPSDLATA